LLVIYRVGIILALDQRSSPTIVIWPSAIASDEILIPVAREPIDPVKASVRTAEMVLFKADGAGTGPTEASEI
jgi:hypothetical protein